MLAILAAMMPLGLALPATAADPSWVSSHVRGTVVYLVGDKWEEITQGQSLVVASVRTLRSGQLSLETDGLELHLGSSSVLELGSSPDHAGSQLRHYIGTMTISTTGNGAATVFLQAGRLSLAKIEGEVELTVSEASTALSVHTGSVLVRAPGGGLTSLPPGEYVASGNGVAVATAAQGTDAEKGSSSAAGAVLAGMMSAQSAGPDSSAGPAANGVNNGAQNGAGSNNGNAGGAANGNNNAGGTNGAANSGNPNAGSSNNNAGGNANPSGNPNAGSPGGGGNGPAGNNAGGNGNGNSNANPPANGNLNQNGDGGDDAQSSTDPTGVIP